MSEPQLKEKAAVMRCIPARIAASENGRPRLQRFHLVQRTSSTPAYTWISQHRHRETAQRAFGELADGDRCEARIFDMKEAAFIEGVPCAE